MQTSNFYNTICSVARHGIMFLTTIILFSCSEKEINLIEEEAIRDVEKVTKFLHSKGFATFEEALLFSETNFGPPLTKSSANESVSISEEAFIVLSRMENVQLTEGMTLEDYHQELLSILFSGNLNSLEQVALYDGVEAAIAIIQYKISYEVTTKGFWDTVWSVAKCVGGTVGSAGLGALAGAAVGTVTLPVIGTVSGTAVGAVSGALVGVASFC